MKRKYLLLLAALSLLLVVFSGNEQKQIIASAESAAQIQHFRDDETGLNYHLYIPTGDAEHMPLIVYLHGGSGKGSDFNQMIKLDGFPQYLQQGVISPNAYVLMPQLSADQRGWEQVGANLITLIQKIASEYDVDADNISLTGHSMGGTGAWNLAISNPDVFARIAPLSGAVRGRGIAKLKNVSVWAFAGEKDNIVPPESSEKAVALLQKLGGDAAFTLFSDAGHTDVPREAYLDESIGLLPWLVGGNT